MHTALAARECPVCRARWTAPVETCPRGPHGLLGHLRAWVGGHLRAGLGGRR